MFTYIQTYIHAYMHTGQSISLDGETEVHALASLLKLYLRELPEPLLTYHLFDDFINATTGRPSALCSFAVSLAISLPDWRSLLKHHALIHEFMNSFISFTQQGSEKYQPALYMTLRQPVYSKTKPEQ